MGEVDHVLDSEVLSAFEVSGDAHQIQKADGFCTKMDGRGSYSGACVPGWLEAGVGDVAEAEIAAELLKPDRQLSAGTLRQLLPPERLPDEFRNRDIRK